MRTFTQNEPLTDAELDRLGDFLKSCKGGGAMNIEQLDGFFAALIAGTVMPSEYYRILRLLEHGYRRQPLEAMPPQRHCAPWSPSDHTN